MRVVQTRKNRKTGLPVQLCTERITTQQLPYRSYKRWWAQCSHGARGYQYRHKSYAIDEIAHPDRWCGKCEALAYARALEKEP
jgi:hypothetical protein